MRRLLQLLLSMSRWERWLLLLFLLGFASSSVVLVRRFHLQNTVIVPGSGGTYIEGSVGDLQPLNPWFIVQNDVNRDIVSLVFSGLLRYNPQSRKIEEDLATMDVSKDQKVYTLTLRDGVQWHDSTPEKPHPVTADDVVFTFTTVQHPQFPNDILQQNFRGVRVEKVDERTVRFTLDQPYSFFPSNLTLGLLPQKSFEGIPPSKLSQAIDFGFAPVGAGPYTLKTIVRTDLSTEVTLERFPRPLPPPHQLERAVFRIFADYTSLLSDLRTLNGVRLVPRDADGKPVIPKRYESKEYTLPQYVALFFNLQKPQLQDQTLRVGLQLGTNKQALGDLIHEPKLVDTPLLEIDTKDWHYQFDADAAQGALLASKWNLPERVRLQRVLEEEDANAAGLLHPDPIVRLEEGRFLTLSGSIAGLPEDPRINGIPIVPLETASGSWRVNLPHLNGSGAIVAGTNLIKITGKNRIVDSFYLFGAKDPEEETLARAERVIAKKYVETKGLSESATNKLRITDLALERGMLRMRSPKDAPSVRVNEKGQELHLRLVTSNLPPQYAIVAQEVQKQWSQLGVKVSVEVVPLGEFEDKLLRRDYDVVLFGQSLLDNLDSYPYWHSSGVQKLTGQDGDLRRDAYNLSQYVSFSADALLEKIRKTPDDADRAKALTDLRAILTEDVPAIFLYSPLYVFAHHQDVLGVELGSLSLHSDRFLTLFRWYVKQDRVFKPGIGWGSFIPWLLGKI